MAKGWECPKCGSVYAPHVRECDTCKNSKMGGRDSGTAGWSFTVNPTITVPNNSHVVFVREPLPIVTIPADGTSKGFAGEA